MRFVFCVFFDWIKINFFSCFGILLSPKFQSIDDFEKSVFSNLHFSMSTGWIFFIKVAIEELLTFGKFNVKIYEVRSCFGFLKLVFLNNWNFLTSSHSNAFYLCWNIPLEFFVLLPCSGNWRTRNARSRYWFWIAVVFELTFL